MHIQHISFAIVLILLAGSTFAKPISVSEDGHLGLYQAIDFRITDGNCNDCKTIPQALWYFKGEALAVPLSQPSDFSRTAQAQADIADWLSGNPNLAAQPPLIWLGSDQVIVETSLSADGKRINDKDGSGRNFDIEAKISTNRSYWNDSTLNFFKQRPVRLRGKINADKFVARTVWPLDYRIMP
ncbi:MAG: hypothetical protein HOP23_17195 [Methylococcaceae bacterium]|nr:hypothetical protein [Methylococcaceae bacterium]